MERGARYSATMPRCSDEHEKSFKSDRKYCPSAKSGFRWPWAGLALDLEEAVVNPRGSVFQPELIELMKTVLEDAAATLPEAKCTSAVKAAMASQILSCAAKGERNPSVLKSVALSAPVDLFHPSHEMSVARQAV